jgi:hypothetical protein
MNVLYFMLKKLKSRKSCEKTPPNYLGYSEKRGNNSHRNLDMVFIKLKNMNNNITANSSIKNPCVKNEDPIKNTSEIIYVSLVNRQITFLKYSFEKFDQSPFVCSLTNLGLVRICESEFFIF